jgi:acetoin utilization deacetylase AcuC-like enzyme
MIKLTQESLKTLNIVWHEKYLDYFFGEDHPFDVSRALPFIEQLPIENIITPAKAKNEDILLVHTKEYLQTLKENEKVNLTMDTFCDQKILEASLYYVGGTIKTFEIALKEGFAFNLLGGLHHSCPDHGEGFCIFNDISIAIKKYQHENKMKKVLVLDIDVHAGNGTQEIFYNDNTVFAISLHQNPLTIYPGRCFENETGLNKGKGFNKNVIIEPYTNGIQYLQILKQTLKEIEFFDYDLLVIVFGADTYKDDILGNLELDFKDYVNIANSISSFNKKKGNKPVALLAAGGYSKEVHNIWISFLNGFLDQE